MHSYVFTKAGLVPLYATVRWCLRTHAPRGRMPSGAPRPQNQRVRITMMMTKLRLAEWKDPLVTCRIILTGVFGRPWDDHGGVPASWGHA